MEHKYKEGEMVFAIVAPDVMLIVRRYVDDIYYCRLKTDMNARELVYFERELSSGGNHTTNFLNVR
jgi:hypothetical protein